MEQYIQNNKKDWKNIHWDFRLKLHELKNDLQNEWEDNGFDYGECKKWIDVGLKPSDADYAKWLRDGKKVNVKWISSHGNDQKLRKEFAVNSKLSEKAIQDLKKINEHEDWNLTEEEETKERKISLIRQIIPYKGLRDRYYKYGLCKECNQINTWGDIHTKKYWCHPCYSRHFQENFKYWTSGNIEIDKFIQNHQVEAINKHRILEWIPYEKFTNIEYLAEGGFGKVYKAEWVDGPIEKWNIKDKKWERLQNTGHFFVLKVLNNSQGKTKFLQEVACHKLFENNDVIVQCFGISQDPKTKNYVMVMEYIEGGNLRQYLKKYHRVLKIKLDNSDTSKLKQLMDIVTGLNLIHYKGLMHRDLHPGNILNKTGIYKIYCYITDLGLSQPADEENEEEVYGVLPYVALEVYTQASDVYSFGIVAYEILSGLPPYHELRSRNLISETVLALKICQGMRPKFNIKLPQLLEDLIKRCWDADPLKRPTAKGLFDALNSWGHSSDGSYTFNSAGGSNYGYQEFYEQYLQASKFNRKWPPIAKNIISPCYEVYSSTIYTSRLIDTKGIAKLLKEWKDDD